MLKLNRIYALILLLVMLVGCDKNDSPKITTAESRTVFAYLGMHNNLSAEGLLNIEMMIKGATRANIGSGTIIVYHDKANGVPRLLRIYAGADGQGTVEVVKEYADNPNSADGLTLRRAINDMMQVAPASSYAMIMGSHSSGWLPSNNWWKAEERRALNDDETVSAEVVLEDNGLYMELSDFAAAMPSGIFDFIIFDECYMAGIEVLWALREKAHYIVASSAEILSKGMPYDKIISSIFAKQPQLGAGGVCDEFFKSSSSCTISLIDCSQLDSEFADAMSAIITASSVKLAELSFEQNQIQYYDRYSRQVIFDIKGYAESLAEGNTKLQQSLTTFRDKLNRIVRYKRMTDHVIGLPKAQDQYSGITCYIPFTGYEALTQKYTLTEWYQRVYK